MSQFNPKTRFLVYGLMILSSFLSLSSWALSSDSTLPAHFKADHISHNIKTNVTIFVGNVYMEQGTTHLTADKVTAYKNAAGQIYKIVAMGKPAHYNTLPEEQKPVMDAYGNTIIYLPLVRKADIIGQAQVIQQPNSYSGAHLVYDMAKQLTTALPGDDGTPSKLILQPQDLPGKAKNQ